METTQLNKVQKEFSEVNPYTINRNDSFDSDLNSYHVKSDLQRQHGMYAYVSPRWTIPLAKWIGDKKCLEVMAGAGHLSNALKEQGVNVIATDDNSWSSSRGWPIVTEIYEMNCLDAITKYAEEIDLLIISWPYMDSNAYQCIKLLHTLNPNANVIYIGEGEGGCTADDEFFAHFIQVEDEAFETAASNYRSWPHIYDRIWLGKFQ